MPFPWIDTLRLRVCLEAETLINNLGLDVINAVFITAAERLPGPEPNPPSRYRCTTRGTCEFYLILLLLWQISESTAKK